MNFKTFVLVCESLQKSNFLHVNAPTPRGFRAPRLVRISAANTLEDELRDYYQEVRRPVYFTLYKGNTTAALFTRSDVEAFVRRQDQEWAKRKNAADQARKLGITDMDFDKVLGEAEAQKDAADQFLAALTDPTKTKPYTF